MFSQAEPPHPSHEQIGHGPEFASHPLCQKMRDEGFALQLVHSPSEVLPGTAVLLLEGTHLRVTAGHDWRARFSEICFIAQEGGPEAADLLVGTGWPERQTRKAIQAGLQRARMTRRDAALSRQLAHDHQQLAQLTALGIALSAETDIHQLLQRLLTDGRALACCDAASLFLIDEREDGSRELLFKLTQNASIDFPFTERRFPLNDSSLAGYVAGHGCELNFADVYQIPADVPYGFHRGIDEAMGYRTVSMLVLPITAPQGEIIGVLEFLNRKDSPERLLRGREVAEAHTLAFTEPVVAVLRALAGQAGVAIANNLLVNSQSALFDGFVAAALTALAPDETEGDEHGLRVGELALELAHTVSERLGLRLPGHCLRDLRYACLLHDFGQAGPRKSKASERLAPFRRRIALERERVKRRQFEALLAGRGSLLMPDELARLDNFLWAVEKSDVADVRPEELFADTTLAALASRHSLLSPPQLEKLDQHLRRSLAFLTRIDWRDALAMTEVKPSCAGEALPLGSRLVLLCDIYARLTDAVQVANLPPEQVRNLLNELSADAPGWRTLVDALPPHGWR